jgi:hypothetical protein
VIKVTCKPAFGIDSTVDPSTSDKPLPADAGFDSGIEPADEPDATEADGGTRI